MCAKVVQKLIFRVIKKRELVKLTMTVNPKVAYFKSKKKLHIHFFRGTKSINIPKVAYDRLSAGTKFSKWVVKKEKVGNFVAILT